MKKISGLTIIFLLTICLSCGISQAITLGDNITIWDGMGVANEDNEAEPGCVQSQSWDLEGFFMNGHTLTMVGGYDFVNGVDGVMSGDLFIDIDGDAKYGSNNNNGGYGNSIITNTFGYDYVLDIDFGNKTYDVFKLTAATNTESIYYNINQESNPWRYHSDGIEVAGYQNISFADSYWSNLTGDDVADLSSWKSNDSHYAAAFDLSFLGHTSFTSHFTMECGNDDLMGRGFVAPEPSTILLMCAGLFGLVG
ncbi:MAG: PEP-CTERM sorting domain-containing protein, partial [Deltaproteobacteria bacterium]|nr:PEP-CTERM sorting domain-containing protein [Candidatus Tharpella sp.]